MKARLSGFLCIGLTSFALLGGCSDSDGKGGAGGNGGDSFGGSGDGGAGGSAPMDVNPLMPTPTVEVVAIVPEMPMDDKPNETSVGSEGPIWVAAYNYLLFSDQAENHDHVFKVDAAKPAEASATIFPYKLGAGKPKTNGLTIGSDGFVYVAEASTESIWKFKPAADGVEGTPELVADKFNGAALGKVNDLIVSKKGIVYFTSAWNGSCSTDVNGVYAVGADKVVKKPISDGNGTNGPKNANGVALSPDECTLYVADDQCYTSAGQSGFVWKYPIAEDGTVGAGTRFITGGELKKKGELNVPDGITVDDVGNLYIASNHPDGHAIFVYKPDGTPWGKIAMPADGPNPSNLSFGGADRKTLFVTAGYRIYKIAMPIPGAP